ncbi:MAG TPA: hypothetical protein VGF52_03570 [Tepidisphaeraceae bacterium]
MVILLVAIALRLAWIATLSGDDESLRALPDQVEYLQLGRNLYHGQGLQFFDERFGQTIWAYRTPGYPLLVAMCGGQILLVRVMQVMLDAASVLGIYFLAKALSRKRTEMAIAAAAIVAVNPFLIYFCGLILSETLFAAMLVWGMLLLLNKRALAWWAGAILLAMSVLVRPGAMGLPILLGIVAGLVNRQTREAYHWRGWMPIVLTILVLLPWAWRNERVLGSWIWTTTNGGITEYDGFNPQANGASNQRFVESMPQLKSMNEIERSQYLAKRAGQFASEHPLRSLEFGVIKIVRTLSPLPLSAEYGRQAKLVAVALIYMVPLDVLIVLGLWRGQANAWMKLYLLAPAIYFTIVSALSVGSLRYRIPADVPMAVVAAMALGIAAREPIKS